MPAGWVKVSFHCPACNRNAPGVTRPRLLVIDVGFVELMRQEMNGVVCTATPATDRLYGMLAAPAGEMLRHRFEILQLMPKCLSPGP